MRTATASVILLTIAAHPACASEAFIVQVTGRAVAAEAAASAKTTVSAAMLALPVKLTAANAFNLPHPPAATSGTNTSLVSQTGTNNFNFAAVTPTGGGNASAIVQRGSGNQAIVTQRH